MNSKPIHDETNPLDVLMDAAVDAIIIIDSEGIILRFNQAAQEMFVYTAKEVCGRNVSMLMSDDHSIKHDEYIKHYLNTGKARVIGLVLEVHQYHS